ncbi:MAG: IS3 family transposase [Gammaproteobacteria bacterium]
MQGVSRRFQKSIEKLVTLNKDKTLRKVIREYIDFCNTKRLQSSSGSMTPQEFEQACI